MRNPAEFDAFYVSARDRLLLETFALTGDQVAARSACQAAFAAAWHHWGKVGGLEDREAWVRPRAHRRAQQRHTARLGRRDKSIAPEQAATLEALSELSQTQRKALVLVHLSPLSMAEIGREVEVPQSTLERELQLATSGFALERDVQSTQIRGLLESLRDVVGEARWSRASIVRRAGAARRRSHTLVGAAAVVAAMLVAGTVVTAGGSVPASLDGLRGADTPEIVGERAPEFGGEELIAADSLGGWGADLDWRETATSEALEGDAESMPCQADRFADPDGWGSVVRGFEATTTVRGRVVDERRGKNDERTRKQRTRTETREVTAARVVEAVELSRSGEAAEAAYAATLAWYAGCLDRRVQLLDTQQVDGIGEQATVLSLRSWGREPGRMAIGIARSGGLTVTTMVHGNADTATATRGVRVLADAVSAACLAPEAGTCTEADPVLSRVAPYPIGKVPGMLGEFDLPPVDGAPGPWIGTDPVRARVNVASTRCDRTEFRGKGIRDNLTRTFLFPEATRADELGLTQSVATMKQKRAKAFVDGVRQRIRNCGKANLGTRVTSIATGSTKNSELYAWHLDVDISDSDSVQFLMAIVREGDAVSQIGFVPTRSMTMSRDDFRGVVRRALDRLGYLV